HACVRSREGARQSGVAGHFHRHRHPGLPVQPDHRYCLFHRRPPRGVGLMGFLRRFLSRSITVAGLAVFFLIVAIALGAPVIFAHGPFSIVGMPLLPPGATGLLAGSDVLGRDMVVGLAYGARISLLVGITSTCCAVGIGVLLGA